MRWVIYFKLGGYNATNKNYDIYLVTVVDVGSLWSQICHETEDDPELLIFLHFPPRGRGWGYYKRCTTYTALYLYAWGCSEAGFALKPFYTDNISFIRF